MSSHCLALVPCQLEVRTFFPVLRLRAVGGRQHEEEPLCRYTSEGLTDTSSHRRGAKPVFPVKCKAMHAGIEMVALSLACESGLSGFFFMVLGASASCSAPHVMMRDCVRLL